MECPLCHNKKLGQLGRIRYYCNHCNVEIVIRNEKIEVYEIEEDGELTKMAQQAS